MSGETRFGVMPDGINTVFNSQIITPPAGTTTGILLRANPRRYYLSVSNDSVNTMLVGFSSLVFSNGFFGGAGIFVNTNETREFKFADIGSLIYEPLYFGNNGLGNGTCLITECWYVSSRRGNGNENGIGIDRVHNGREPGAGAWSKLKTAINRFHAAQRGNRHL